jgi:hypothetical protein
MITSLIASPQNKPCYPFLSKLTETGRPVDELLGNILGVAVGASVNYAQASVHVIEFYLDSAREKEYNHIVQLSKNSDAQSAELLRGYVCEAMRALCPIIYRVISQLMSNRFEATVPRFISRGGR